MALRRLLALKRLTSFETLTGFETLADTLNLFSDRSLQSESGWPQLAPRSGRCAALAAQECRQGFGHFSQSRKGYS
ncbi:MAG: hypothetical protein EBW71_02775 [Betaproteobacteria bacterium]|nr:hypothetical protein [Betaproteobacteria bacterium]